jgi:hypothetical protein
MRSYAYLFPLAVIAAVIVYLAGCTDMRQSAEVGQPSEQQRIERGKYLVSAVGCHDCHSPKTMTPQGPVVDESRMLSGHRSDMQLPPIDTNIFKSGYWTLMGMDGNTFVGPWGVSFPANLTPDSATGLGAWTEAQFIKTLRTGKHLGLDGGRDILPPMPWNMYNKLNDEDLASIFAYLHSLKPVRNQVPTPIPPTEVGKLTVPAAASL